MNWKRHNGALKGDDKKNGGRKNDIHVLCGPSLSPEEIPHPSTLMEPPLLLYQTQKFCKGGDRMSSVRNCRQSWLIPFLPQGNLSSFSASVPPSILLPILHLRPSIHPSIRLSVCPSSIHEARSLSHTLPVSLLTVKIIIKITAKQSQKHIE